LTHLRILCVLDIPIREWIQISVRSTLFGTACIIFVFQCLC